MVDHSHATDQQGGEEREEQRDGGDRGARQAAADGSVEQEAGKGAERDEPEVLCGHRVGLV